MEIVHTDAEIEQPNLPWHKPEIQSLSISLDTANSVGSGGDAGSHEFIT